MLTTTIIYFSVFIISLFFCRLYEKKEKNIDEKKKLILIVLSALPLILLATIRYDVGTDYMAYIKNSANIVEMFSLKLVFVYYSREPLYVILTSLGVFLFKNFVGAIYIYSIIFVLFMIEGIRYYKDKISMTMGLTIFCLAYYLIFFNATRQMMAFAIIFFASRYLYEKKFSKYVFWIIIAGLIHKTAYIMIFAYLLNFKLESKKAMSIYYILIVVSPLLMYPFMRLILIATHTLGIFSMLSKINIDLNFRFLLYLIPEFIIVFTYRREILKLDSRNELFYRLVLLQFPAQMMGVFVAYADRISIYFGMFEIVLMSLILKAGEKTEDEKLKFKNEKIDSLFSKIYLSYLKIVNDKRFKIGIIVCWYVFYFCVKYALLNSNGVYPYNTIFQI